MTAILRFLTLGATLLFVGCMAPRNTITQVSMIDALLAASYDGTMTCGELLSYGDLGIGTFDKLDGEMIVLDGKIHQFKCDGTVALPPPTLTTPFADVVRFEADATIAVPPSSDFAKLKNVIDRAVPNKNLFCAIRLYGTFASVKTRSVPAQKKPYPNLAEVAETQPIFNYGRITGTIVGFRSPEYAKGITVSGYHLHFVSDDLTAGGHILDFQFTGGLAELDVCNKFTMILPNGDTGFANVDLTKDRSNEMKKAEQ